MEVDDSTMMKLYLISQSVNRGWDTYDSAVVAATHREAARQTHPSEHLDVSWDGNKWVWSGGREFGTGNWAVPSDVEVKCLGNAFPNLKAGVICSSFNAG